MVTVQSVHKLALEHEVIASYLPDLEDLSAEWMPREFLFSIVHSLEPSFFQRAITEHQNALKKAKSKVEKDTVEVNPEMLEILQAYARNAFRQKKGTKNRRSGIRALSVNRVKRKRAKQVQLPALTTAIGVVKPEDHEVQLINGQQFYKVKRFKLQ